MDSSLASVCLHNCGCERKFGFPGSADLCGRNSLLARLVSGAAWLRSYSFSIDRLSLLTTLFPDVWVCPDWNLFLAFPGVCFPSCATALGKSRRPPGCFRPSSSPFTSFPRRLQRSSCFLSLDTPAASSVFPFDSRPTYAIFVPLSWLVPSAPLPPAFSLSVSWFLSFPRR